MAILLPPNLLTFSNRSLMLFSVGNSAGDLFPTWLQFLQSRQNNCRQIARFYECGYPDLELRR